MEILKNFLDEPFLQLWSIAITAIITVIATQIAIVRAQKKINTINRIAEEEKLEGLAVNMHTALLSELKSNVYIISRIQKKNSSARAQAVNALSFEVFKSASSQTWYVFWLNQNFSQKQISQLWDLYNIFRVYKNLDNGTWVDNSIGTAINIIGNIFPDTSDPINNFNNFIEELQVFKNNKYFI